jgi:peptidoglycan/xylan/chitin deacetylase (PgdA/CDA1 family)
VQRAVRTAAGEAAAFAGRLRPRRHGTARVVYYHRIDDEQHRSCVAPAAFAEQMAFLKDEGFAILRLSAVRAHLDEKRPFPERSVIVTFDDGFADNYTQAFPVLCREAIPATIFLAAGFMDGDDLPAIRDRSGIKPLRWSEVREMARHGVEFGAHTISHRSLTALDDTELAQEIQGSRALIAEHGGVDSNTFCYPRGHFDERVKAAVRSAGFRLACTTMPGCVTADTHPFSLRRTFIARDDTLRDFKHKLDGSFDFLHSARQRWFGASAPTMA